MKKRKLKEKKVKSDCGLPHALADAYRAAAKEHYHDAGYVEIDANAPISAVLCTAPGETREGVYVQAWVWVPGEDVDDPLTKEEE